MNRPLICAVAQLSATKSRLCFGLLAIALTIAAAPRLHGQAVSGINGTVVDQTGAVVANAEISVTNVNTNVVSRAKTTDVGTYHVTDLNPGTYTVKVEKPGFKPYVATGVVVQTGAQTSTNVTLRSGGATEVVEVAADPIALETEQPEVSTTIQETLVQELPVQISGGSARQIDSFLFLAPGVTGDQFSHRIDGGLDFQNELVFDGVPVAAAETQGYQFIINPPYELVKEFTVLQGAFSAQYGLSHGVAQYGFQSGGNRLHGDGFFILRDSYFDAPGAFNDVNVNNRGKKDYPNTDVERDYGFSLGGPVFIPKVYNGQNKTFWYASYDHYYQSFGLGAINIPTQAELGGDFSKLTIPGTSTPIPIIVPIAWGSNPALMPAGCVPGAQPGQQFPGNIIPKSCISTVSQSLLGLVPSPNAGGGELFNYVPQLSRVYTNTNWGITVDHKLTSSQALHGVFWRNKRAQPNGPFTNALNNAREGDYLGTGAILRYTDSITSNLIVTGGVSWMGELNPQHSEYPISGFAGAAPVPGGGPQYLPGISFNGGQWEPTGWGTGGWSFSDNRKLGVAFMNNWLYIHGRHTMNFGGDIRRTYQDDFECQQCAGNLDFEARTTSDTSGATLFALGLCPPVNGGPATGPCPDTTGHFSGNGFASFLLGNVDSGGRQLAANSHLRNLYVAPYFQDNIKITPKLTVNAGLRWDIAFPFSNVNSVNRLVYFDRNAPNPAAVSPSGQPLPGAMAIFGKGCTGCGGFDRMDTQLGHFSPRLGFAYRINDKTTLLTGLSFSYLDTGAFEYGTNKVAVSFGNALNGSNSFGNNSQIPGLGLWDTTPLPVPQGGAFSPTFLNSQIFTLVHGLHKDVKQAYSELFTFGAQRELPWKMFSSVEYVHTHDIHLPAALMTPNTLSSRYFSSACAKGLSDPSLCVLGQGFDSPAGQAYLQSLGMGACNGLIQPYCNFINDYGSGFPTFQALVPFPQYGFIQDNFDTSGADEYNALQVSLQKRTGSGVTFLVSYTLSRTLTNTDSGFSTFNFKSLDREKPQLDWSIGNDDRTHVLNISGVYELPIGPGKRFLNAGGLAKKNIAGGWQLSGIFTYHSGTPLLIDAESGIFCSPTIYTTGQCNLANALPGPFSLNWNNYYTTRGCSDITACPGAKPVFNPGKFTDPGAWTEGNAKQLYSSLRNPFEPDETIALAKKFYFGERVGGELRMEFYNVLNRMQPGNCLASHTAPLPGTAISTNAFGYESVGQICQNNTPRTGQAFLKITF